VDTTPTPAPAPAPVVTASAAVPAFMGQVPTVSAQQVRGGAWARYEDDFAKFAEQHWASNGANDATANYYDRAMIYYVWWARTGNATYRTRADQLAINHRTYLESVSLRPQPYMAMIDGVALHALLTGDARSAQAVRGVADFYSAPGTYWATVVGDTLNADVDARGTARILNTTLDAWFIAPVGPARDELANRLRTLLPKVLRSQRANGVYPSISECGFDKPFMSGMLNEALIRYHTAFEADSRILPMVQRSVDYLWANAWVSSAGAFRYIMGSCNGQSTAPAADLNNMIVTGFGFVGRQTNDASYFSRGDAVFSGAVYGAWLGGSKQFNQQYTSSYRYLGLRF
jgi:hypothetical protein